MDPKSSAWCFIKRERFEDTEETQGRIPYEDGGRDWSYAVTSQGMPRIVGNYRKLEEAKKDSTLEPLRGAEPC